MSVLASKQDLDRFGKILYDAASRGDQKQAVAALDQGADVNWRNPNDMLRTPLHIAAYHGHESTARLLLDMGASIDSADRSVWTPLHVAAWQGHESVVRMLLERGASINAGNRCKCTPLYFAASTGHLSIVRLLLDRGADTTIESVREYAILDIVPLCTRLTPCYSTDCSKRSRASRRRC